MKFKFLGTAAAEGVPGLFCDCDICEQTRKLGGKNIRTRSQSLINNDLLIDFPADTYFHVLRDNLEVHKIHDCIITHDHQDHFYPNDFIMRAPGFANLKDNSPFNVYGSSTVIDRLNSFDDIKNMVANGCMTINEVTAFKSFSAAGYKITPLKADHISAINPLIYLIERDGKIILYAHDTGVFPDETWNWLQSNQPKCDFATFDCCYGLKECINNHMGFDTVCDVKKRLERMGIISEKTICCVNHFSHNVGPLYEDMQAVSSKHNIQTAFDGMEVDF